MIGGIIGDVVGSVYEGYQWQTKDMLLIQKSYPIDKTQMLPLFKNLKWVRQDYSWTDDTLCTLALYSAYIHNISPVESLLHFCKKYEDQSIGFGKGFSDWLNNPVPYQSHGNGAIMRLGFIPFLTIPLHEQIDLGYQYTAISHNHPDSFQAVYDYLMVCYLLKQEKKENLHSKQSIKNILIKYNYTKTVEDLHQECKFEMNALQTFLQACVIVLESNSIEETLTNSFYVGGDSDTLACIASNIASILYELPNHLVEFSLDTFKKYPDLEQLTKHFLENSK